SCWPIMMCALRNHRPHEIIVADGGSADPTREAAVGADIFLTASRGRAIQMNAGAARASGDVLLFLHADCSLGPRALIQAESCLRPGVAAGCFTMRVAAGGPLYRWIDCVASARVRLTGMIYGDQGLFVRRSLFQKLGGFPRVRFLEDIYLSWCLRRHGRLVLAPAHIIVSPRRWQRAGIVR